MKIVHVSPSAPYNEGWGYQENLLPHYQKALGHEIILITTNLSHKDGKLVEEPPSDTVRPDGIRLIRLPKKEYFTYGIKGMLAAIDVYPLLLEMEPDMIFFHGMVSVTMLQVARYKRRHRPDCILVQDNHLDYCNCGRKSGAAANWAQRTLYRWIHRRTASCVDKIYGVTPWRKTFAEDYFRASPQKTDVLIMGADDEQIRFDRREELRDRIRAQYGVKEDELLVVTGGKIDEEKNIHLLMEAVNGLEGVKLLVFGNVVRDMEARFNALRSDKVLHIGWLPAEETYDYYLAADLVVFPGTHSVMWEQACACKVPCVFARWDGMDHVNNGGNSLLLSPVTVDTLGQALQQLKFTPEYEAMKQAARSDLTDIYLYSRIAEKSLECIASREAAQK